MRVSACKIRGGYNSASALGQGMALERCTVRAVTVFRKRLRYRFTSCASGRASHGAAPAKCLGPKGCAQQNSGMMNYEQNPSETRCPFLPNSSRNSQACSLGSPADLALHLRLCCSTPFSLPTVARTSPLCCRATVRRHEERAWSALPAHASFFSHCGPTVLQPDRGASRRFVRRSSWEEPRASAHRSANQAS